MGTILDFERIGILLNSFSVISGFCADMLDRNYFGQCIHFGGLYPFCELVHSTAEGYRRCLASDRGGCTSARLCGQDYYVYRCHIGLTEMCFPVVYNGEPCGYIIFGSMLTDEDPEDIRRVVLERCADFMPQRDKEKWRAAKYIRIQDDPIWERIDGYIGEHIHDRITVENISAEIFISPSTIYHRTKQNTGMSLSNYVARRKMIKASEYLYLTDYKINYISTLLGIDDYNYFSRLFRRIFGMSPTQYRSANIHRLGLDPSRYRPSPSISVSEHPKKL
jgi:AraC-like DNA-binding protein